jgi:tetratricopeptide (TPR) repeat protein
MIANSSNIDSLQQALALISSGKPDQALLLLAKIPGDSGLHPHVLHLGGLAHAAQGRTAESIRLFEDALPWLADSDELHANLARAYFAGGRFADALRMLDKVADLGKADAAILSDRAILLEKLGKDMLALSAYDAALEMHSAFYPAWARKANLLHNMQRYDEALACYDRVVVLQPGDALARSGRASTLYKLGRMDEGLIEHQRALALDPHQAAIWSGQGVCLVLLDRLEDGLHCFDRALDIDPAHPQAMINRASLLAELYRFPESLPQFDAALQRVKNDSKARAQALFFKGMAELALGNPSGWAGYEYRLHAEPELLRHDALASRWTGAAPLRGKRILLWGEQGYGDVIQFCRYAVSLSELGASVILEVPEPLLALCASLPAAALYPKGADLPPHDLHIPMMSMPLALQGQPRLASIPSARGYLEAQPRSIEKWRRALPPARKLRIGVACSGAPHHPRNARRSIPLEKLRPLTEAAALVILQPELTALDAMTAATIQGVMHPSLDSSDFADVAGLIANVDLVISVDTSIAHLAGAMGVPVWILLPWNAEWRWLTTRSDTPWYESARLFRQHSRNDWDSVVQNVLRALNA